MIWTSWNDFFSMGGYAPYVWGSYCVVFGALAAEIVLLRLRRRDAREQVARTIANQRGHSDEAAS
jgi:heme exporter protein D